MGGTFDAIEVVHKTLFEFYLAAHCFKCVNRSRQTGKMFFDCSSTTGKTFVELFYKRCYATISARESQAR